MGPESNSAFLTHYGVKGMKWGVRNDQYRDYHENATTDTETSRLGKLRSSTNMYRYFATGGKLKSRQKYDEKWYNNLDTGKQYIRKGQVMRRVVRGVDEKALAGRLYVAKRKDDANMYRATIPYVQKHGAAGKKTYHSVYQVELTAKKRMAMPSEKERIDTFIETIQTETGRNWLKDNGYKGQIDELNAKKVGLKYYKRFNKYAGNQEAKFNDTYFNAIKKKGYDAILDDNDAGVWSKEPTILLSPAGTVKVKSVRQLSAKEINDAQRKVMKYRNFKDK